MWVINRAFGNFQVGYFMPDGKWVAIFQYTTAEAAAERVHYLNGGN